MKKTLLFTISVLLGLIFLTYPEITKGKENGSPGGKTNSPIDGSNCTGCHNTQLNNGQGSVIISSDMQNNEYVPGETYTITVTASHPSFTTYGFELTAENGASKAGSFTITSSETKLVNGGNAVTHKSSGIFGLSTKTWNVNWTAPGFASSLGTVDFYACAVTANGNGENSGDEVHTANIYTVTEQQSTSIQEKEQLFSVFYSNGRINIDNTNTIELITIYNINGQVVKSINPNTKIISTSELSDGIYIVELSDVFNNKSTTKVKIY